MTPEHYIELHSLLINLATWRNCPVCKQKIDRGFPPNATDPDTEDMWPYWHCHASNCDLRLAAEAIGTPTAISRSSLLRTTSAKP